jgi:hypothetical protein
VNAASGTAATKLKSSDVRAGGRSIVGTDGRLIVVETSTGAGMFSVGALGMLTGFRCGALGADAFSGAGALPMVTSGAETFSSGMLNLSKSKAGAFGKLPLLNSGGFSNVTLPMSASPVQAFPLSSASRLDVNVPLPGWSSF